MNSCIWRVEASEDSSSTYKRLSPVSGSSLSQGDAGELRSPSPPQPTCVPREMSARILRPCTPALRRLHGYGEGRRLTCPGDTVQAHDLLATQDYLIDCLTLRTIQFRMAILCPIRNCGDTSIGSS